LGGSHALCPQGGSRAAVDRLIAGAVIANPAAAQKKYIRAPATARVKLGQTMSLYGPLSGFITLAKAEIAYFQIDQRPGWRERAQDHHDLAQRRVFSPPKTVEKTRKLVEEDQVLAMSELARTATNAAVQKYCNTRKVPQLFLASGAHRLERPQELSLHHDAGRPIYQAEAQHLRAHVLKEAKEAARPRLLYRNDDFGKGFHQGFRERLGDKASAIMAARSELR